MAIIRALQAFWHSLQIRRRAWLAARRARQLESLQAALQQRAWQNSLAERGHKADLAAGYNLNHFNTMQ